jgi:uroporphyrinogen decarboxylase
VETVKMMGADDVVMATIDDPSGLHAIQEYVQLLIAAGADLVVVLEPTAVMLSPEQFAAFSGVYVRHLTGSFRFSGVDFVYHTCGNTMHLVDRMVRAGFRPRWS